MGDKEVRAICCHIPGDPGRSKPYRLFSHPFCTLLLRLQAAMVHVFGAAFGDDNTTEDLGFWDSKGTNLKI